MKNYKKMTSAQLQLELKNANAEEVKEINAVLEARQAKKNPKAETKAEAKVEGAVNPEEEKVVEAKETKSKLSEEELSELAKKASEEGLNHRCEVVPFNTIEWKSGTIVGVVTDKRANKVLYAIRLDDSRRIVKAYGSKLLKVSEEVVERSTIRTRTSSKRSEEEFDAQFAEFAKNVGYPVEVDGNDGRITGIVRDRRFMKNIYRIKLDSGEIIFRSETASFKIGELDEIGKELNEKYAERAKENCLTVEEKIAKLEKVIAGLEKTIEEKKKMIEELKKKSEEQKDGETKDEDIL